MLQNNVVSEDTKGILIISAPAENLQRRYIISAIPEQTIIRKLRRQAGLCFMAAFVLGVMAALVIQRLL